MEKRVSSVREKKDGSVDWQSVKKYGRLKIKSVDNILFWSKLFFDLTPQVFFSVKSKILAQVEKKY